MGSVDARPRIGRLSLAVILAIGTAVAGLGIASVQSTSSAPVTIVFKAASADFEPQSDGTTRLVLEGMAPKARIDAPDAPKGVNPTVVLEADADGAVAAQLVAREPTGGDPVDIVLTDVQYESDDSISAIANTDPSAGGSSSLPDGALFGVTLTTEVDRPSDSTTTTTTPERVLQSTAGAGAGYSVTMPWTAAKYKQMDTWIFQPVAASTQCVDNEDATAPMTITDPTGGRGWPHADINFAFVVNNDGACFWKSSKMEFWVKTGTNASKAGSCKYEVKQIGPRAFEGKALEQSSTTSSCDATGGINVISGYLTGKERN